MKIATLLAWIRIERIGRKKTYNDNKNYKRGNSQNHKKFVSDTHHLVLVTLFSEFYKSPLPQYFILHVYYLQCLSDSRNGDYFGFHLSDLW